MAIVRIDPPNFGTASSAQIDSDAPDNSAAIRELDDWAAEHGYVRTREYWLRRVNTEGRLVFRGIVYRPGEDEIRTVRESIAATDKRLEQMPATAHFRA